MTESNIKEKELMTDCLDWNLRYYRDYFRSGENIYNQPNPTGKLIKINESLFFRVWFWKPEVGRLDKHGKLSSLDLYIQLEREGLTDCIPEVEVGAKFNVKSGHYGKKNAEVSTGKYYFKVGKVTAVELDKIWFDGDDEKVNCCHVKLTAEWFVVESKKAGAVGVVLFSMPEGLSVKKRKLPGEETESLEKKGEVGGEEEGKLAEIKKEVEQGYSDALEKQMRKLFYSPDNYSDLTLISVDGVEYQANRFLLAAKSPRFNELLLEKSKKKDSWNGKTLKLNDIEAKPLVGLLHWIYTGELHEDTGKLKKKALIQAAIKYQTGDLLKLLEDKLASICDKENLGEALELYELAKKNGMQKAGKEIAEFLLQYIQLDVNKWISDNHE